METYFLSLKVNRSCASACSASPVRHDSLMFGLLSNLISCSRAGACVLFKSNPTPFFLYSGSTYCPKLRTSHSILILHECDWWVSLSHIWVWFPGFVHSHVYVHASSWRKPQWTHLGLPSCCQNIWIQYFFCLLCIDCLFCPLCLVLWKSAGVSLNA